MHHIAERSKTEEVLREDMEGHRLVRRWHSVVDITIAVATVVVVVLDVVDLELGRILLAGGKFDGLGVTLLAVAGLLALLEVLFAVVAVVPEGFHLHRNICYMWALY